MSVNTYSAEIENINNDIKEKEDDIDEVTFPKLVSLLLLHCSYHYISSIVNINYYQYH